MAARGHGGRPAAPCRHLTGLIREAPDVRDLRLTGLPRAWAAEGRWVEVEGHRLWVRDDSPRAAEPGPTLVFLHGFPTSSHDLHRVWPALLGRHRAVVHDHLGFGLSDKPPGDHYSLMKQASRALTLWRDLGIERAVLVAHDYGTSVATEILARHADGELELELEGLVMCNGSMHIELAALTWPQRVLGHPLWGPVLARLSTRRFFQWRLRKTLARPLPPAELEAMWAGVAHGRGRSRLPRIGRYLDERRRHWDRWIGALERWEGPALVLWGDADPIAVSAIAKQLVRDMPQAELRWLPGVGHYPMLEAPEAWSEALLAFIDGLGDAALGDDAGP